MRKSLCLLLLCDFIHFSHCSPAASEITPPPVLKRTLDNDPAFRGYTSTLGSWSPLYCYGDYTYSDFGNIADCCSQGGGICHPATECGTDSEGSTRAIKYQGGETLTCFDTTCGTQTIYKTEGDPNPLSIFGCFAAGELYLTTPGSPVSTSTTGSAASTGTLQSSAPSSLTSSAPSAAAPIPSSTSHVGLIAGGATVGVILLLAIAGLTAWVIILKRKNATTKSSPNTELQKMQGSGARPNDGPPQDFKAELPTKEGWAAELSPESAPPSRQEQKPWSNLNSMPQSPAPTYSPVPPYQSPASPFMPVGPASQAPFYGANNGPYGGLIEAPGPGTQYQELPASTQPQYAELR
ncbi:uncharacterized protein PV09_01954 [Verruconis gallopava]|uniref:Mid2 domain-containing protein n=1 Tax=Verruconis gallopava TaxID=253628 RepID=A0A0D2AJL2_9PEZI|nr:uncharacterized protein PV09_01954 [Verruconis gallopava]KIW07063.1 hypothetical protein PV09_01954 [Verruconis gallopava]